METLYDTSILIELYKLKKPIKGYTTIFNIIEFPKALKMDLTVLYPSKDDYKLAVLISKELVKLGSPVPAVDIVISAIAINNGMKLITKDRHFVKIKNVIEEFVVEII